MKRLLTIIMMLMISTVVMTATEIDGIYYELDLTTRTATVISGPNPYTGVVNIPTTVSYMGGVQFRVTSIGDSAFEQSNVTSVTIPNSVVSIGNDAFNCCTSLISITIPTGVKHILNRAFIGCINLTSIALPSSVVGIGDDAFSQCYQLTSITIPSSVTSIGRGAFSRCISMTSINVSSGNNIYDSRNNCNAIIETTSNTLIAGCQNSIIPWGVTCIGSLAFDGCINLSSVSFPSSVTSIEERAFQDCSSLVSIDIPTSVTNIGTDAFCDCSNLASVIIPQSVESIGTFAFGRCNNLISMTVGWQQPLQIPSNTFLDVSLSNTTLYVPVGTKSRYNDAPVWKNFGNIVENKNIDFADSRVKEICVENWDTNHDAELSLSEAAAVTDIKNIFTNEENITSFNELQYFTGLADIPYEAFHKCTKLTSVIIPNSVKSIGERAFFYCSALNSIDLPNSVTSIGKYAFYYCSSLISASIPGGVRSIPQAAFTGCSSLTSIDLAYGLIEIGDHSFWECTSLVSIDIPNSVRTIKDGSFSGCSSLTSIYIPSSVNSIYSNPFSGCDNLVSISVSPNNTTYDSRNNCNAIISSSNYLVSGCNKTIIPASVTNIGVSAFAGFSLTSIDIPNSVKSIQLRAFQNCSNLTSVFIPSSVTSIGMESFNGCSNLISVSIPQSVTSIGEKAFARCTSLNSVAVGWNQPLEVNWDVFAADVWNMLPLNKATLYVPTGTTNIYKTTEVWKEFGNIVENNYIGFADDKVKEICLANWDLNHDGELCLSEAASVTDLGEVFKGNSEITSFNELQYFTGLTSVGRHAFDGCMNLTSITLPNSITSVESFAFSGCGLQSIDIPNGVTRIGDDAFSYCGLTSVVIPASVTSIDEYAFSQCGNLASITVNWEEPLVVPENIFDIINYNQAVLYVPEGTKAAYKAADVWKKFFINGDDRDTYYTLRLLRELIDRMVTIGNYELDAASATADRADVTKEELEESIVQLQQQIKNRCGNAGEDNLPVDATGLITNPSFTIDNPSYWQGDQPQCEYAGGYNQNAEFYERAFDFYQELTGLPNGRYLLKMKGFHRPGPNGDVYTDYQQGINNATAQLYGNNRSVTLENQARYAQDEPMDGWCGEEVSYNGKTQYVPNFMYDAKLWFSRGYYENELLVFVSDGTLRLGIRLEESTDKGWVIFDDFRLEYLGDKYVNFVDDKVKEICVANWDTDLDDELSYAEAATVTDLNDAFQWKGDITLFDELKYFSGLTSLVGCFEGCVELRSIIIPSAVETINGYGFSNCPNLESIKVDEQNPWFDSRNDCNAIIETATNTLLVGCQTTVIPDDVTSIGNDAFWGRWWMETMTIPSSVTTIGAYAFAFCGLTSITIPQSVTSIGNSAFWSNALTSVTVEWEQPLEVPEDLFMEVPVNQATLYVPSGTKAAYAATNVWKDFYIIVDEHLYVDVNGNSLCMYPGKTKTFSLCLDNSDKLVSFEFSLQLPEGISIATDEDGDPRVWLNSDRSNYHTVTVQGNANGLYHFLCYSTKDRPFKGNTGELLNIRLVSDEGKGLGTYHATVSGIIFNDDNATPRRITLPDFDFDIKITNILMGDVNDDQAIDVTDVVVMVKHILEKDTSVFIFDAADHNEDGVIDVMDIVEEVDIIMKNALYQAPSAHVPYTPGNGLMLVSDSDGSVHVTLPVTASFVATQFIINLSTGQRLVDVTSDKTHTVCVQQLSDDCYFVVCYSLANAVFANSDHILTLRVAGQGTVSVEDATFVDENEQKIVFQSISGYTTGIAEIAADAMSPTDIYSTNGMILRKNVILTEGMPSGVYIINGKKYIKK